jgi:hypothetical protein
MIDHLFTESWTALVNTESVDSGGTVTDSWATDASIGTSGVIMAHSRNITIRELLQNAKNEINIDMRLYTKDTGLTIAHRLKNSDDEIYSIVAVDDPHNYGKFYQVDLVRSDSEVDADG